VNWRESNEHRNSSKLYKIKALKIDEKIVEKE
jgi:hypothetical protein